jgi:hypothetical protein
VLSFFSSRRNWDSPNPSPAGECAPPPRFWGEGHTRWRERGWEIPNSVEGTYTVVLFIYTYFVNVGNQSVITHTHRFLKLIRTRSFYTFFIPYLCADTPGLGKIGVLAENAVRRSTRRKRVRGEKEFIVDSDTLLRDLKVKVSNS